MLRDIWLALFSKYNLSDFKLSANFLLSCAFCGLLLQTKNLLQFNPIYQKFVTVPCNIKTLCFKYIYQEVFFWRVPQPTCFSWQRLCVYLCINQNISVSFIYLFLYDFITMLDSVLMFVFPLFVFLKGFDDSWNSCWLAVRQV